MSYIKNLNPEYYVKSYKPLHICIDDFSIENSNAKLVLNELKKNNLLEQIFLIKSDFRKKSKEIQNKFGKIHFIWFDCGGPLEYQDFINEYWSIVEEDGYLIFHFTFSYAFEISNFLIPTTSQSELNQIEDFLDKQTTQFDELIAKSKAQITLLEEKRQALITATVTGKIDVRSEVVA